MTNQEKVLIVEDEENERTGLGELVSAWGYRTETARDGLEGLEKVITWSPAVVITDLKMPRMDGMELLHRLAEQPQPIAVVLLTAQGSIDLAVDAMKIGAYDFIQKPVDPARLKQILQNAVRHRGTSLELEVTKRKLRDTGVFGSLVGSSRSMQEIFRLVEMVAPSTASVLITGESGTGKELVARTIHEMSPRKSKPFVAINCSAIPETLIESEIFEIGEMPIATQAKLLRVLEDHKLRRLGSKIETPVDVRVLAATNKVPEEAVSKGELRNDLYYRLNVFNIHMPPLREHKEDVPQLVDSLLADMSAKHSRDVGGVNETVLQMFTNYNWPGNVRELRNTLERAVIVCEGSLIEPRHLPPNFGAAGLRLAVSDSDGIRLEVGTTVEEAEKMLILKTLTATNNNKTRAAEILGISLKTLHNKLKEYGGSSNSATEAAS
jgi:DNA-binding NtrC family response regulator